MRSGGALAEELGLDVLSDRPVAVGTRARVRRAASLHRGQRERVYLVRVEPFVPMPRVDLSAEHVTDMRWWTLDELEASTGIFGPRRLPPSYGYLIENGPPVSPPSIGR